MMQHVVLRESCDPSVQQQTMDTLITEPNVSFANNRFSRSLEEHRKRNGQVYTGILCLVCHSVIRSDFLPTCLFVCWHDMSRYCIEKWGQVRKGEGTIQTRRLGDMSSTLQDTDTQREACWLWFPLPYTVHTSHCTQQYAAMETAKSKVQPSLHLKHWGNFTNCQDPIMLRTLQNVFKTLQIRSNVFLYFLTALEKSLVTSHCKCKTTWTWFGEGTSEKGSLGLQQHTNTAVTTCSEHAFLNWCIEHFVSLPTISLTLTINIQNTTLIPGSILHKICHKSVTNVGGTRCT